MAQDMRSSIESIRVAVLLSDGFEQSQLDGPVRELKKLGIQVDVLAPTERQRREGVQGLNGLELAQRVIPDQRVDEAMPDTYDGLLIPGGAISADSLRISVYSRGFASNFLEAGKPIAVSGHGAWILADTGALAGYTLTSWPAIRKDLERAGAIWKDQDLIQDRNLITTQKAEQSAKLAAVFMRELVQRAKKVQRSA